MDSKGQPRVLPDVLERAKFWPNAKHWFYSRQGARSQSSHDGSRKRIEGVPAARLRTAESLPPRAGAQHGVTQERAVAVVARGCPVEAVEARVDVPPNE